MRIRLVLAAILAIGELVGAASAHAAAIVIENQTAITVRFTVGQADGRRSHFALASGDLTPIAVTNSVQVVFESNGCFFRKLVRPNSIHCFEQKDHRTELVELLMPDPKSVDPAVVRVAGADGNALQQTAEALSDDQAREFRESRPAEKANTQASVFFTVPVMLLVDDREPTVRAVWEKRLRTRLEAASDIFERYCRVRFKVMAVGTWSADTTIDDFNLSVAEFERKVQPAPAKLAIGFTSHYQWAPGESHVGGIRGPLRSHILVREALVRVSEPERLEVLVHELGHYLGAAHSAAGTSVMRPMLGDRRSCARSFRIGFDAPNTLAMYLLAEQLQARPVF